MCITGFGTVAEPTVIAVQIAGTAGRAEVGVEIEGSGVARITVHEQIIASRSENRLDSGAGLARWIAVVVAGQLAAKVVALSAKIQNGVVTGHLSVNLPHSVVRKEVNDIRGTEAPA